MAVRNNRPTSERMTELRMAWGGCCEHVGCDSTERLQFAHVEPTTLSGKAGRGSRVRMYDIVWHPWCYALLCYECHRRYDSKGM
jgi:hypothetical protein